MELQIGEGKMARIDKKTFGQNLKAARGERDQKSLADSIKVDKSLISKWERGHVRPHHDNEENLRHELGVESFDLPVDEFAALYGLSEHPHIKRLQYYNGEFEREIKKLAMEASKFVNYASLCRAYPYTGRYTPIELADDAFLARLKKEEIPFNMVQVFFHENDLVNAMRNILQLSSKSFACVYYPTPKKSIPSISFRSYDDRYFIIGGFHDRAPSGTGEYALLFDHREPVHTFLTQYWKVVWEQGSNFPAPSDWLQHKTIHEDLGLTKEGWKRAVKRAQQRRSRRLAR
jgi:transcriptional regulator with XRE-family HTH domain